MSFTAEWTDTGRHPRRPWKVAREDLEIAMAYCRHRGITMKELVRSIAEHTVGRDDAHWLLRAWYGSDVQCFTDKEAKKCLRGREGVELALNIPGVSGPTVAALTSISIKQSINAKGWAKTLAAEKSLQNPNPDSAEPPWSSSQSLAGAAGGGPNDASGSNLSDTSGGARRPPEQGSQPPLSSSLQAEARDGSAYGVGSSQPRRSPPPPPPLAGQPRGAASAEQPLMLA